MKTWLHFIGREYYPTPDDYVIESKLHGPTRRVSMRTMAQMTWGDRVLVAQVARTRDGKKPKNQKASVIFGEFSIETVSGLSRDAIEYLQNNSCPAALLRPTNITVARGCGSYRSVSLFSLDQRVELTTVAHLLRQAQFEGENIGSPMVGGTAQFFTAYGQPIKMRQIGHLQGFRTFDYEQWVNEIGQYPVGPKGIGIPQLGVPGQFYDKREGLTEPNLQKLTWGTGVVEEVEGYKRH